MTRQFRCAQPCPTLVPLLRHTPGCRGPRPPAQRCLITARPPRRFAAILREPTLASSAARRLSNSSSFTDQAVGHRDRPRASPPPSRKALLVFGLSPWIGGSALPLRKHGIHRQSAGQRQSGPPPAPSRSATVSSREHRSAVSLRRAAICSGVEEVSVAIAH